MSPSPTIAVMERIRFLACAMAIVFVLGWSVWFSPYDDLLDRQGTPLGADFSMFYVAGQVVSQTGPQALYDQSEHQRRLQKLFPDLNPSFCLPFRYPPVVAAMMAPLSRLPYPLAWSLFTLGSLLALASALWLMARIFVPAAPEWGTAGRWAIVGWPVVWEVIAGGQASHFGLMIAAGTCLLLQRDRQVAAGAVLALAACKPNLLALLAIGIIVRYPRVLLGAIPTLVGLVALSAAVSEQALYEFGTLALQLTTRSWDVDTPFWKVHSLAGAWNGVFGGHGRGISLALGAAAASAIGLGWRRAARTPVAQPLAVAALLVVNSLFNPYTPIYDLVLLALAGWMVLSAVGTVGTRSATVFRAWEVQVLLAGLFFGPHISQALARPCGMQLFPLILIGLTTLIAVRLWQTLATRKVGSLADRFGTFQQVGPQCVADQQAGSS